MAHMKILDEKPTKESLLSDVVDNKKEEEDVKERDTWGGKLEFIMAALSLSVGMGNLWRFPYLCYRNGGGLLYIYHLLY